MSSVSLTELLDALDNGAGLLLPNARSARELRSAFDSRQKGRGLAAWDPPQVLSWSQWTNLLWSELVVTGMESRLLLNAAQEQSLWTEIVDAAAESPSGSAESLADLARSAWKLAASYNAAHRLRVFATTQDSRIFAGWAETFLERCEARDTLSGALLDHALLRHLKAGTLVTPACVEMVGFAERRPSQEALLDGFRGVGTEVREHRLVAAAEGERLRASVIAADKRDELLLAARWIRESLETSRTRERRMRVAILLPDPMEECAEIEEVLREVLAPELQSVSADLSSAPWEFSGGVPLSSLAMISDALALARWANGPLPVTRVSPLLFSPYVGHNGRSGEHLDAAARFDAGWLRRTLLLRSEIEIEPLLELATRAERNSVPEGDGENSLLGWLRHTHIFLQRGGDRSRLRSFAEWMEFVRGLTRAANWPGDRALTAAEFEATSAWESTLDLVSTLDFSGRRVRYVEALQALERQARTAKFAPPSAGAPVQIMSLAEAEGSIFDAIAVLRATDDNLPALERVNPLLPWALQRSLKMPGSNPALTATKSRTSMEDLLRRSGEVLFTCAAEDESGNLRPSPLFVQMGLERLEPKWFDRPGQRVEQTTLESYTDACELPKLRSAEVVGGASVLKLQAACGFLAFAEMRLRATAPRISAIGMDAAESGILLHRALQNFWKTAKTQDALRSMKWAERDSLLARAIEDALPRTPHLDDRWEREYLEIQKERLRSVLQQWLEIELQRGNFTVLAVEQEQAVTVGPLTLSVRMDRIDKVGEGVFFVDYKTGYAADPKQWMGDRPEEPQLPLYALLPEPDELKGIAFAKVRTGYEMKWSGYQAEEGVLSASSSKQKVEDLVSHVEEWRRTLTQLAEDFAAGRADVRPKSFEVNCARCAQRLLCRVDPKSLLITMADGEDAEEVDG